MADWKRAEASGDNPGTLLFFFMQNYPAFSMYEVSVGEYQAMDLRSHSCFRLHPKTSLLPMP